MLPGIFMLVTTIASLLLVLFKTYLPKQNYVLAAGDIVLLGLAAGVLQNTVVAMRRRLGDAERELFAYLGPAIGPAHF